MDRIELINGTIHRFGYRHYLEIGVQKGACFEAIRAARKTGVDPDMHYLKRRYPSNPLQRLLKRRLPARLFWQFESDAIQLYELTSDDFFARNDDKFDLVFIDGLHLFNQVLKDYVNAQKHLSEAGCVMLHDCNPLSAESAKREPSVQTNVWNGDTWKAIYYLRRLGQQIDVYPFDQGCAVAPKQSVADISWSEEDLRKLYELPFEALAADRTGAVWLRHWPGFTEEFTKRFRAIETGLHSEDRRYRPGERRISMVAAQLQSLDLTICTVSYESSDWLRLNLELTTRLNPGRDLCWIIAENSLANSPARLPPTAAGFRVIAGAPYREMPYASASYHHAAGMNIAVREVATRYLLVLDPDFYIVRKHWIDDVTRYMHENHIAILGAPWHPGRVSKIRYFPCAHCTFFDLQQIDRDGLDFSPQYEDRQEWVATKKSNLSLGQRLLASLTGAKRRRIGTSRDTGWRIYQRYSSDPRVKSECLQPVFNPRLGRRMADAFYPDHLRYTPARPGYFRRTDFEHFGLPGPRPNGWEEFFWQGEPFGFHVRCFPLREKATTSLQEHYEHAERLLAIY